MIDKEHTCDSLFNAKLFCITNSSTFVIAITPAVQRLNFIVAIILQDQQGKLIFNSSLIQEQ